VGSRPFLHARDAHVWLRLGPELEPEPELELEPELPLV
jgi:hypothetical protein